MRFRFLFACLMLVATALRAEEPRTVLTLAEQPVRLIRGAAVYKAGTGVAVQKDDILETEAAGAQVEAGADAIVALRGASQNATAGRGTARATRRARARHRAAPRARPRRRRRPPRSCLRW